MGQPDGNTSNWIRTTVNGLIPYQSGGASALGTSSWPFANGFINTINASMINVTNTSTMKIALYNSNSGGETSIGHYGAGTLYWVVGKACGGTGDGTYAWWYNPSGRNLMTLNSNGQLDTRGGVYSTHPTGGEVGIGVAHGSSEFLYLWGNNSSGTRGLFDTTKGYIIQVSDSSTTFYGDVTGTANTITSTLPLTKGGTGVTSLNDLRKLFREWAPLDSSNDTTSNWGVKGLSVAGYGDGNTITDKPSTWGIILNVNASDTEVHQLWFTQSSGRIYHRGGNASGWNGTWRLMYSHGDSIIYSSTEPSSPVTGTIWLQPA